MKLTIRAATSHDIPQILTFIRELALYEREPNSVLATEADLLRDGFGPTPRFWCVIADIEEGGKASPAGFALYFTSYSTWLGHHGIRLEDLYVTPTKRGQGIGKALLRHLARVAVEQGCPRLEWDVLKWNTPAIDVYESLGAATQTDWSIMRLAGEALARLATANT
jgi:GNAT superfamily N-acetyltransferase